MTLIVTRNTGQLFCGMSLSWDLSGVFLMIIDSGHVFWGGRPQMGSAIFIKGTCYQHGLL